MSFLDEEIAALPQWEARCTFLYLDLYGNPTTAIGYEVPDLNAMLALPWKNPDRSDANSAQVEAEWNRVKAMPPAMVAKAYESPEGLTLLDPDIDALTEKLLLAIVGWLPRYLPKFDTFPDPAKVGCLDMGFNLGPQRFAQYHQFIAAGNQTPPNYMTMSEQCKRNANVAAFMLRNSWTADLFVQAAAA